MPPIESPSSLTAIGFSKREAAVYVAIQKLQRANAHQVAKTAGVERTTVYDILEDLVVRGLVTKSIAGKRQTYVAEPPEKLEEMIRHQQAAVATIIPFLRTLPREQKHRPVVRFYETIEGIRQVLMATISGREKIRRDFASVDHIVDFLGQRFIDQQIEARVKKGVRALSLRNPENTSSWTKKDWYLRANNQKLLREVRYLPKKQTIEPTIFLHDDTITVISSKQESFALVVDSPELCQALKALFDMAWAAAIKGPRP